MSSPSPRPHRRGLTLIEVMATITVMAIVLPVAMRGIALAGSVAGLTRQRAQATALAESKLDELLLTQEWQLGDESGDFGSDFAGYRWESVVGEWEETNMRQLQVSVIWVNRGNQRQVVLSTLVYDSGSTSQ